MGWFSTRIVDHHVAEWQFENFEWLIRQYGSGHLSGSDALYSSNKPTEEPEKQIAKTIFFEVMSHIGLQDIEIELVATIENKPRQVDDLLIIQPENHGAMGRYICEQLTDGSYKETITYDQDLIATPELLAGTFAHELSHLLHNRATEKIPVEDELYELFTDLTALFLGFGVLLANQRFDFSQTQTNSSQGWRSQSIGYLPEADIVFAIAVFLAIYQLPEQLAANSLKPHLAKLLTKANKQLQQYQTEIDYLRELLASQTKQSNPSLG